MARALGCAMSVGIACWTSLAVASPAARLVYGRGAGAEKCPDEVTLRKEVAARVGYDPFFPYAPRSIVLTIFGRDGGLAARVDLVEAEHAASSRELVTRQTDCEELFQSAALAIAIAIDPRALVKPVIASPQEEAPSEAPTPPPAAVAELLAPSEVLEKDAPTEPRARISGIQTNVRVAAGPRVSAGLQPGVAAGAFAGFGAVWRRVSVGAELAGYLPTTATSSSSATAFVWVANTSLVPCLRFEPVTACGVATAGRLEASGEQVVGGTTETLAFFAAGGRAGVELPLVKRVKMHFDGELLGNLARPTVKIGAERVWKASAIAGSLGAAVSLEL